MARLVHLAHQGLSLLLTRQSGDDAAPPELPQQSLDLSSYPTTGLQQFGLCVIILFPALSVLFVGLRTYSRATTRTFGVDDYFIIAAAILAVAEAAFSYAMMKLQYIGVHEWQLPTTPSDPTRGMILNYVVVLLYNPELGLVKSSVLFFLLRLGGHEPRLRRLIQVLNWFNMALLVAVLFASIFTCVPVNKYWDRDVPGVCNAEGYQYLVTSGLAILTNVLVLSIPVWIVVGLQIARKLKVLLICVLCSGIIVTVFSILRMHAIYSLYYPPADPGPDPTYDIRFVYSTVECNLAIITATIPALHRLMRQWFPRFFHITSGPDADYQHGGYYSGGSRNLHTIGGLAKPLKDIKSGVGRSPGTWLNSLSNSEEDILAKDGITRTTSVQITFEHHNLSPASETGPRRPLSYGTKY